MSVYDCPRCGAPVANVQGVESCTSCLWVAGDAESPAAEPR
ncbi:MAG: hypothetical protein ABEJ22_07330 [Haloferacaceae archaeon]